MQAGVRARPAHLGGAPWGENGSSAERAGSWEQNCNDSNGLMALGWDGFQKLWVSKEILMESRETS